MASAHEAVLATVEFDAFVARTRAGLLALAFALCADRHVAEDLVQDALLAAFRRWDRLADYDDPSAWARRVVANRATSRWRRMQSETRALTRLAARRADVSTERDLDADRFWEAVRGLPPRQAQMIALRYADDLDIAEIGRVLKCAPGTVKATLHQARASLARRLQSEVADDE